jgi:hypothetical protein
LTSYFADIGTGSTDDTAAITAAINLGNRCGQGCDSSTVTPALVYFPPGTYMISSPLVQLYYTQFVGDAVTVPTIKATANFQGIALIDSDPYAAGGANWYTNQNNFFRQVRNFIIDTTAMPVNVGAGIHWQVAQATSLQNIVFNMRTDGGDQNRQQGIFMDNGSGGFMTDLTFNGGNYGVFFGNQQFTTRNLKFNNCRTAIFMNWNWVSNLLYVSYITHLTRCRCGLYLVFKSTTVASVWTWPTEAQLVRLWVQFSLLTAKSAILLSVSRRLGQPRQVLTVLLSSTTLIFPPTVQLLFQTRLTRLLFLEATKKLVRGVRDVNISVPMLANPSKGQLPLLPNQVFSLMATATSIHAQDHNTKQYQHLRSRV